MKRESKIALGLLTAVSGGIAYSLARSKKYYKKYPVIKELRGTIPITYPSVCINSTCVKFMNRPAMDQIALIDDVKTTTMYIPTYDGHEMMVSVIRPLDSKQDEELPCLVYLHGGAYMFQTTSLYYKFIAQYAKQAHCVVVFPHYRTIFEWSTDVCFEDVYTSVVWTAKNAESLHIDKNRIAVGGDSAGGGLTASVTHMCRDRKGPELCFQMLVYPVIDSTMTTPSMKKYSDTPTWNAKANEKMWKEMKSRMSPGMMKYVAPSLDFDFSGLCNAYVEVEEYDCLHDEGVIYAEKLKENGYEVELNDMKGTYHGFEEFGDTVIYRNILEIRSRALRKAFGTEE